jgi:tRNA-dihydrouridine synthase 1
MLKNTLKIMQATTT